MGRKIGVSNAEIEEKRELFAIWYFQPGREGSQEDWARAHDITPRSLSSWKRRPEFIQKMEDFRKTYREDADETFRNLLRFSQSPDPRAAIPAAKIVMEVMGYTTPLKVESTARGMSILEYVAYVGQEALKTYAELSGQQGVPNNLQPLALEGEFVDTTAQEVIEEAPELDPWQTAEPERLN